MIKNPPKISPLKILDALKLYQEIAPYVERGLADEQPMAWIGGVINRMRDGDPFAYIRCVELMTGKEQDEIVKMEVMDIFDLFLNGLVTNHMMTLLEFGDRIGLKHGN